MGRDAKRSFEAPETPLAKPSFRMSVFGGNIEIRGIAQADDVSDALTLYVRDRI